MQAVVTRYVGPTNTRGSRVSVRCDAARMLVPWQCDLGSEENHATAILRMLLRLDWCGNWVLGGLPDNCGCVAVCSRREHGNGRRVRVTDSLGGILAQGKPVPQ